MAHGVFLSRLYVQRRGRVSVAETETVSKVTSSGFSRGSQATIAPVTKYTAVRPVEQYAGRLLAAAAEGCWTSMLAVGGDKSVVQRGGV
jgi:hypothetical protein